MIHQCLNYRSTLRISTLSRRKQDGFSLIEVLVALGISLISILLIGQFLVSIQSQFVTLQNKIRSEVEAAELMFYLHHYLGMALELQGVAMDLNAAPFNTVHGAIRQYNLASWTPSNGDGATDVVAYFVRDTLKSRDLTRPAPSDRFKPTGIFFQRPTIDRYGVLYITLDPTDPNVLRPELKDLFFEGLVDFRVRNIATQPFEGRNMVSSVTVDITQRHYLPTVEAKLMTWCPPQFMIAPQCVHGNQSYRDVTKSLTIKIRNNVIGESISQRVLSADGTYQPWLTRTFDNLYFLRAFYPKEALSR